MTNGPTRELSLSWAALGLTFTLFLGLDAMTDEEIDTSDGRTRRVRVYS